MIPNEPVLLKRVGKGNKMDKNNQNIQRISWQGHHEDYDYSKRILVFVLASVFFLFLILQMGCGGSRSKVIFNSAKYPVSMTETVPDRDGSFLSNSEQEILGKFEDSGRAWSIFWTLVPLNCVDFSEELNQQVSDAGGEAVVNTKVTAGFPFFPDTFPGILYLHWLPIFPGSVHVDIQGDIIRSTRKLE